ncbi:hypothetical protein EAF04_001830 [Stromatinia cepivora]|nr:hypothetical protein EAF04_001830 [Stromatinia cepivora]
MSSDKDNNGREAAPPFDPTFPLDPALFLEPSGNLGLDSSPIPPPSNSAPSPPGPQRRGRASSAMPSFMANGAALVAHSRQLAQSNLNINAVNRTAPEEYQSFHQPVYQPISQPFKQSSHYPDPKQINGAVDSDDELGLNFERGSMPYDFQSTPNPTSAVVIDDELGFNLEHDSNAFNYLVASNYPPVPTPATQRGTTSGDQTASPLHGRRHNRRESAASRNERTLTRGRRHRRRLAEEFAPAATSTAHAVAHNNSTRRENRRNKNSVKKKVVLDDHVQEWVTVLDSVDVTVSYEDMYEQLVYQKSYSRGTTIEKIKDMTINGSEDASVDGTDDTTDTYGGEQQIPPAPPADPGFPVSQRWRQRGPAGLAKARWATARYNAKKKVKKTDAWLAATPEEREEIERVAADAIIYIADTEIVGPVPPRSHEPWLRSERHTLLRIIDENNRSLSAPSNRLKTVADTYNNRMRDVQQRAGELCIAIGNGQSRRDSQLANDRIAPVRTPASILSNLNKWIDQGNICACREHQRYLIGDFENSGGFPHGHGIQDCLASDLCHDDACNCEDHLRDYNGNFPEGHCSRRCRTIL